MRAKFFVYCNRASSSAYRLAKALGGRRIKRVGSKYKQKKGDVVINYGCSDCGKIVPTLQKPYSVKVATSKMATFDTLYAAGLPIPMYTKSKKQAQEWASVGKILGRNLDRGSQGRGITVYKKGEILGDHLFYVKYMKKEREFRYHVVGGKVVHIAEKMRIGKEKRGDNYNQYVRSHGNGWVLAFHHLAGNPPPEGGERIASYACGALMLDFGAVDMGWNPDDGFFILEVNTGPGIEETTLEKYNDAIRENW
jgi:glutathione synthase/RimK-type ligase-like ATP-grasp enzyme